MRVFCVLELANYAQSPSSTLIARIPLRAYSRDFFGNQPEIRSIFVIRFDWMTTAGQQSAMAALRRERVYLPLDAGPPNYRSRRSSVSAELIYHYFCFMLFYFFTMCDVIRAGYSGQSYNFSFKQSWLCFRRFLCLQISGYGVRKGSRLSSIFLILQTFLLRLRIGIMAWRHLFVLKKKIFLCQFM